ncbi:MAG: prenyltransferase [Anaerolineae bacterium]|nr:prenyltransferase [Anaerolineae bacterium]
MAVPAADRAGSPVETLSGLQQPLRPRHRPRPPQPETPGVTPRPAYPARLAAFFRLGRPLFLAGGLVTHALGVAIALSSGTRLNLDALLWGQIAITAIQWMTHYSNDYFDLDADRANRTPTHWSGGSRVLTAGLLPPRAALITALALAGIAVVAALVLTFGVHTGTLTLPLFALALGLAWFYSAPPLRLHARGVGEFTTALLVGGFAPLTGFYLQRGELTPLPFLAVIPPCCLQFCMLLAVDFPDAAGDASASKRTLVVRLGAWRAARLYAVVLVGAYLALPLLVIAGLPLLPALAVALMSPLALVQLWRVRRGDTRNPARWNQFAFYSIALLVGTMAVEAFAFLLLAGI